MRVPCPLSPCPSPSPHWSSSHSSAYCYGQAEVNANMRDCMHPNLLWLTQWPMAGQRAKGQGPRVEESGRGKGAASVQPCQGHRSKIQTLPTVPPCAALWLEVRGPLTSLVSFLSRLFLSLNFCLGLSLPFKNLIPDFVQYIHRQMQSSKFLSIRIKFQGYFGSRSA